MRQKRKQPPSALFFLAFKNEMLYCRHKQYKKANARALIYSSDKNLHYSDYSVIFALGGNRPAITVSNNLVLFLTSDYLQGFNFKGITLNCDINVDNSITMDVYLLQSKERGHLFKGPTKRSKIFT